MNTETITLRTYQSRRDTILDIFLMENKEDAYIISQNLVQTMKAFTIGDVTMSELIDMFEKRCQDQNINI
jgi:hypothetical protein